MPFERPTLARIEENLQADVRSRLPGSDPLLRRSYLGSLTRGLAGAIHELYGFLEWISDAAFPDSAESVELDRWASIWSVERRAAVQATGSIAVTGTDDVTIDAGTRWRSSARTEYESTAEVTLAAGAATVPVRAVEGGAAGNAAAGLVMNLVSGIVSVVSRGVVSDAIAGGADVEDDASLRRRLLLRLRNPPRGGSAADYELWALSGHADVTRAWVRPRAAGLGTVDVYVMSDAATATGIPVAAVLAAVQAYIDPRRPVTAAVTVRAPAPRALDITISRIAPASAAVRAAVAAEIRDLVVRESEPGGTILLSHIREAISTAAGETDHVLASPTADVTHTASQIAVPGEITWPG